MMPESENKDKKKKPLCQALLRFPIDRRACSEKQYISGRAVLSSLKGGQTDFFKPKRTKENRTVLALLGNPLFRPGTTRILPQESWMNPLHFSLQLW